MFSKHLAWAEAHPDTPEGKAFLNVAAMYCRSQDVPTYGLLTAAAESIERVWRNADLSARGEA